MTTAAWRFEDRMAAVLGHAEGLLSGRLVPVAAGGAIHPWPAPPSPSRLPRVTARRVMAIAAVVAAPRALALATLVLGAPSRPTLIGH